MPRGPALVVEPFGDRAVLITLGDAIDVGVSRRVRRLASAVAGASPAGAALGRPVPGYASLLVPYDPAAIGVDAAVREIARLARRFDEAPIAIADDRRAPVTEVPTRYGGPDGEDLDAIAEAAGLSASEVVALHAAAEYEVFLLGFVPGFAYMGVVPEPIAVPRRATPRARVPRGSVAIAERQTGVYPLDVPGGWNLIGRTDLAVWDPGRERPALLEPGARVRFVPVR
jgi:KipI family sensor histidine kinase inhibitor